MTRSATISRAGVVIDPGCRYAVRAASASSPRSQNQLGRCRKAPCANCGRDAVSGRGLLTIRGCVSRCASPQQIAFSRRHTPRAAFSQPKRAGLCRLMMLISRERYRLGYIRMASGGPSTDLAGEFPSPRELPSHALSGMLSLSGAANYAISFLGLSGSSVRSWAGVTVGVVEARQVRDARLHWHLPPTTVPRPPHWSATPVHPRCAKRKGFSGCPTIQGPIIRSALGTAWSPFRGLSGRRRPAQKGPGRIARPAMCLFGCRHPSR